MPHSVYMSCRGSIKRTNRFKTLFFTFRCFSLPPCWYSGCLNGGGQLKPKEGQTAKELLQKVEELYKAENSITPEDDIRVADLYMSWLNSVGEEKAKGLLHTRYHTVEKMTNGLAMKWWRKLLLRSMRVFQQSTDYRTVHMYHFWLQYKLVCTQITFETTLSKSCVSGRVEHQGGR